MHAHPPTPALLPACLQQRAYGFIMGGNGSVLAANSVCILVVGAWTLGERSPHPHSLSHLPALTTPPRCHCVCHPTIS